MPQAEPLSRNASPTAVDAGLLVEQTMSSLFASIVRVYRRHFRVITLCYLLPMFPFVLLDALVKAAAPEWALLAVLPMLVAGFVVGGLVTITVSDICLGNQPTVRRSYTRILASNRWWQMISTGLLLVLASLVPVWGLWVSLRGLFSSVIVALEGRHNRDAIRRSFALTKGQVWRILGLVLPTMVLLLVLSLVVTMVANGIGGVEAFWVHFIGNLVVLGVVTPALSITMVLLYYDQRVRRESYDAQALAEDLMR